MKELSHNISGLTILKNVKTLVNPVNLVGIVVSLVWTITS